MATDYSGSIFFPDIRRNFSTETERVQELSTLKTEREQFQKLLEIKMSKNETDLTISLRQSNIVLFDLILQYNRLKKLLIFIDDNVDIPEQLGDIMTLESLAIRSSGSYDNVSSTRLPDSFCNLINLKKLNIYGTKILNIQVLSKPLINLESFDLIDCNLTELQTLFLGINSNLNIWILEIIY